VIFRQLFERESSTYTYLLADEHTRRAALIDPVDTQLSLYLRLLEELDLRLEYALDTHVHADHVTALGLLRDTVGCKTLVGFEGEVDCASSGLEDGQIIKLGDIDIHVLFTPGHTDDSFSFLVNEEGHTCIFSGDTLLIRGTGRTDFQNGDPRAQYDSIFNKLLKLPEKTMVFPAHDYKGETVSTIGEEKAFNPRLQVKSIDEYVELMNNLNLPNPKMMDVAVPANMRVGLAQDEIARRGWAVTAEEAMNLAGCPDVVLVDLREVSEREKQGIIPGSLHAPYPDLAANVRPGGMLHELAAATGKRIVFYCAFGERSAMAVQAAHDAGLASARHIHGGIGAWKKAQGPLQR
jgi:sulfur dioxygenase